MQNGTKTYGKSTQRKMADWNFGEHVSVLLPLFLKKKVRSFDIKFNIKFPYSAR